ncbi:MAG: hypothetical protein GY845_04680 [Planctomycetes bacterium]|nr:hypothetical protein [Planctomycetota bacterium]
MKKAITRTIIVFVIVNLITAGFAIGQDVIQKENQEVLEKQTQEADVAQKEAEFAAQEAQVQVEAAREQIRSAEKQKQAKMQMGQAEKQLKAAEKQMKVAEKQMQEAVVKQKDIEQKVKDLMVDIRIPHVTLPHLSHLQQGSSGGGVLVIPSVEMKVENLAAISEDMNVMSRIFDTQLNQTQLTTGKEKWFSQRYHWLVQGGSSTTEAIYLEGYGALFLMKINMLLSAPPEAPQKEKTKEDEDPVWSQMRREMYEPEEIRRSRAKERPEEKYDAEKVETLKTNLIKTLKHATNIQALEPEQLVILTVIGDRHGSTATVTQSISYGRSTGRSRTVQTTRGDETSSLLPTVLTICAKKSDIDAYAKGELDYDQFRQRTGIFKSYAKAGQQDSPGVHEHQVAHEEYQTAHQEHTAF